MTINPVHCCNRLSRWSWVCCSVVQAEHGDEIERHRLAAVGQFDMASARLLDLGIAGAQRLQNSRLAPLKALFRQLA